MEAAGEVLFLMICVCLFVCYLAVLWEFS